MLVTIENVNFLLSMEEKHTMNAQLKITMVFCGVSRRKAKEIGQIANLSVLLATVRK